jgi:pimeloyl-ACP methyl ester carboxylesterase
MKIHITAMLAAMLLFTPNTYTQQITGQWNGALNIQGTQLRLVLHVNKTADSLTSTLDSPDQGANGIPVTTTSFENGTLKFTLDKLQIVYEGVLGKDSVFTGTFKQGGQPFPLVLSRATIEKQKLNRPQEPSKPYPYYSEDISFSNEKANISLAGTLTLPKKDGIYPAVILITGSGPQNRDEELLGHKPFLILSDYLTRNGIAVLRYDDRGTASSTGDFKTATSADFATDVEAAIAFLKTRKEIDKSKIGLIGHSEGGLIAPMVAARSKDVAFIVLLAGPGIKGDQLLLLQEYLIGKASGNSDEELKKNEVVTRQAFEIVNKGESTEKQKLKLTELITKALKENPSADKPPGLTDDEFVKLQVDQITTPWMQYFLKYDPVPALEKLTCPVLALNGAKDLQVPPKEDLEGIKNALAKGGNKKLTTIELPNLNHLFQESKTGAPSEYAAIEQTFSPVALTAIMKWIGALKL